MLTLIEIFEFARSAEILGTLVRKLTLHPQI